MLLVNICPKCGRRYPSSIKNCLECGTRLTNNRDVAAKKRAAGMVRKIGIIALAGCVLIGAVFFLVPILNISMVAGQGVSMVVNVLQAPPAAVVPQFTLNQTVKTDTLEVTVARTREGSNVLNADRFFFVTVALRNPRQDAQVRVSGSDFVLTDAEGHTYYTYGLGNNVAQDLPPLGSQTFELEYEIPRSAGGLVLSVYFPREGMTQAAEVPARFAVT